MNIVTKSGTNDLRGSWFTLMRDTAMNAKTETEKLNDSEKQDYSRYQYGGSFGGPIVQDKVHYFGAFERTQQDTFQVVDTLGLFPSEDGTFATPYRETLLTVKGTMNLNASHYLSVRYGRNENSQPYGADPPHAASGWGDEREYVQFLQHEPQLGAGRIEAERVHLSVRRLQQQHQRQQQRPDADSSRTASPSGQNGNTPQTTEQKKWQFRDDFSWNMEGMGGVGHDIKTGFNYIHEPHLFITFNTGTNDYTYTHLDNDLNGPLSTVTRNGGAADANIPLKQYAFYVQDDWRVNDRLTLNLGLRYDLIDGVQFDQSTNPNYVKVQAAGRAGLLTGIKGWRTPASIRRRTRTTGSRASGFAFDLRGDGRDVVRGGWGIYQDVGYTNSNVLFAAIDATGIGSGSVFNRR